MEKIKESVDSVLESNKVKDFLIVLIVILVGLGSFGLGRLSNSEKAQGIKVEYSDKTSLAGKNLEANIIAAEESEKANSGNLADKSDKKFFASSRGSKYYPIGCSAGKSLKEENRIYFATSVEAERSGYDLSSSCK